MLMQGVTGLGFATYLSPLQREFGWSRALIAGSRSLMQAENAVLGPLEGFLMDKLGPRVMVVIGSLIMGLGFVMFSFVHSVWTYYLSNIMIALGSGFLGGLVMSVAINHWFRRKRSSAQGWYMSAGAMGGVVGVPAIVFIQTSMGWRESAILTGLFVWAVCLPLSMLLRRSPEPYGLLPDGDNPVASQSVGTLRRPADEEYDFTLRQALRTRAFWLLSIGQAMFSLGYAALQVHILLYLEEGVGLARTTAAFVWSVSNMTSFFSRLAGGFLGDRLPKNGLVGIAGIMVAIATFVLVFTHSLTMALIFAVLHGAGHGARSPVMNAIQGEYFGRKNQGMIRGWLSLVSLPLTVGAPVVVGYLADLQGTYRPAFSVMAVSVVVGALLMFLATRPKRPGVALT